MSTAFIWSSASLKACVSLLTFCPDDLSTDVRGGGKVPHYYCYRQCLPLCLVIVAPMLGAFTFEQLLRRLLGLIPLCNVYLCLLLVFVSKSVLSGVSTAVLALSPIGVEYLSPPAYFQSAHL